MDNAIDLLQNFYFRYNIVIAGVNSHYGGQNAAGR
jgi:hypothetical protein